MIKRIQILTLAAFVLGGLIGSTPNFAMADSSYDQPVDNIQVFNDAYSNYTIAAFDLVGVNNFSITSVTFLMDKADATCGSGLHSTDPIGNVAVYVRNENWDMPYWGTTFNFESNYIGGVLQLPIIFNTGTGHTWAVQIVKTSNCYGSPGISTHARTGSGTYVQAETMMGVSWGTYNAPQTITPVVYFNGYNPIPPTMSVTAPPKNATLDTQIPQTISGTCTHEGTNELMLTYEPFLARLATSTDFTIQCSEGGFSTTFTPKVGSNEIWVIDKNVIGQNPPNIYDTDLYGQLIYTGDNTAGGWLVALITPEPDANNEVIIYPDSNFLMRWKAEIPDSYVNATSTYIRYQEFDTAGREVNASTTTNTFLYSDSVNADGYVYQYLDMSLICSGCEVHHYYRTSLLSGSTVMSYIDINLIDTNDTTTYKNPQHNTTQSQKDLGFWGNVVRVLLYPNTEILSSELRGMYQDFSNRIPFSYLYQFYDIVSTQSISTTTPDTISMVVPSMFGTATDTVVSLPFLGTTASGDVVRDFSGRMREYAVAGLWLSYVLYLYGALKDFFTA